MRSLCTHSVVKQQRCWATTDKQRIKQRFNTCIKVNKSRTTEDHTAVDTGLESFQKSTFDLPVFSCSRP